MGTHLGGGTPPAGSNTGLAGAWAIAGMVMTEKKSARLRAGESIPGGEGRMVRDANKHNNSTELTTAPQLIRYNDGRMAGWPDGRMAATCCARAPASGHEGSPVAVPVPSSFLPA